MEYQSPKYELVAIESEDILTTSKVKIEGAEGDSGSASMDASDLFN
jgi:hypothetical protein